MSANRPILPSAASEQLCMRGSHGLVLGSTFWVASNHETISLRNRASRGTSHDYLNLIIYALRCAAETPDSESLMMSNIPLFRWPQTYSLMTPKNARAFFGGESSGWRERCKMTLWDHEMWETDSSRDAEGLSYVYIYYSQSQQGREQPAQETSCTDKTHADSESADKD